MANNQTTTPAATLAERFALSAVQDGSHIRPGSEAAVLTIVDQAEAGFRDYLRADQRAAKVVDNLARLRMELAVLCLRENGLPSFNLSDDVSETFAAIWGVGKNPAENYPDSVIGRTLSGLEGADRTRMLTRLRQRVNSVYLTPAVCDYVVREHFPEGSPARAEVGELKWIEETKGNPPVLSDPPKPVLAKLSETFERSNLDIPKRYGGVKKGSGPGTKVDNPRSKVELGAEAMTSLAIRTAAFFAWKSVSALVNRGVAARSKGETAGLADVALYLEKVGTLATYGAKVLRGKGEPKDLETIEKATFNPAQDQEPGDDQ